MEGEQPRERVAVGGVARAADVHRAGRVRADELDVARASGGSAPPPPQRVAGGEDVGERVARTRRRRGRGSGSPGRRPRRASSAAPRRSRERRREPLGDLARRRAERLGQQHRRVGRVVAVLGLPRALERRRRSAARRRRRRRRRPRRRAPRAGLRAARSRSAAAARGASAPSRRVSVCDVPERDQHVAGVQARCSPGGCGRNDAVGVAHADDDRIAAHVDDRAAVRRRARPRPRSPRAGTRAPRRRARRPAGVSAARAISEPLVR